MAEAGIRGRAGARRAFAANIPVTVYAAALALALAGGGAHAQAQAGSGAASTPAAASGARPAASAARTGAAEIEAAVAKLRADPLLSATRKTHSLRFKPDEDKPKRPDRPDATRANWFEDFVDSIADASRILVYGLALVGVAVLAVVARRYVRLRGAGGRIAPPRAVSHVRDLDVRPESLPDDIGGAARALWQRGDVAAALSLLYRGALSRLIHRHAVPIAASTTEGECLVLARGCLDPAAQRYLAQLVSAWEAFTYGRRTPPAAAGELLCRDFAPRLDAAAPAAEPAP